MRNKGREGGQVVWALLALGSSELMPRTGGESSAAHRRKADLYVYADDV
jgi:hypothetical protein